MKKIFFCLFSVVFHFYAFCQISVSTNPPFDTPDYLVNNVLLSSGVQASNFSFQGHPKQMGYFDGSDSNIGLSGGIVLSTGDISILEPSFSGSATAVSQTPPITDPDLLSVANSVPGLIGQSFTVSSINDVAVLEFDFVPSSDTVSFNYVFGSEEYFAYENTSFNDVFGFFISGPGITGPYSSPTGFPDGSINVAVFQSQESNSLGVDLPITVSSICSTSQTAYNPQLFVNNQSFSTVAKIDGFTVSMRAELVVQCGETYHIRLAIADGSDTGLSSFVFLEEKSFSSTQTNIANNLDQDSLHLLINCGEEVTLTAQVNSSDDYTYLWSTNETTQSISVGPGTYWFTASNDGCDLLSDTITVEEKSLGVSLGEDLSVCSGDSITLGVKFLTGEAPYTYQWSTEQTSAEINAPVGIYILTVTDVNNCIGTDSIEVHRIERPLATVSSEYGIICKGRDLPEIEVTLEGRPPFSISYTNGTQVYHDTTEITNYKILGTVAGEYSLISVEDSNCLGSVVGSSLIRRNDFNSVISGGGPICQGDTSEVVIYSDVNFFPYSVFLNDGSNTKNFISIDKIPFSIYSEGDYVYSVEKIVDAKGCESISNSGIASVLYKELISPQIMTSVDSVLCPVDSLVELLANPEDGVWHGKGTDFSNYFNPINAYEGINWVYYSFPQNCNETDSIAIEIGCEVSLYIPNSFTPNWDYDNELLVYRGNNIIDFEFSIFNRWGELMFQTNSLTEFWDGRYKNRVVPPGTYSYVAKIYGKDAKYKFQNGTVNVLK